MKNSTLVLFFSFQLLLFIACTNHKSTLSNGRKNNKELTGKVIGISDGDTFKLLLEKDNFEIRVRLNEIDCPEKKQAFSKKSKQHLSELIFGKTVKVYYKKKDRYGRVLGTVFVGDINVNNDMVKSGYAWHFKKYSDSQELAQLENEARRQRIGLWHDDSPIPPWEWRKMKKKK